MANGFGDWLNDTFWGGASTKAADAQYNAGEDAKKLLGDYYGKATSYQQPLMDTGMRSLANLESGINSGAYNMPMTGGYTSPSFQDKQFNFQADPGYQFRLSEGNANINNSAAANGRGLSGATLRALSRYGSSLASQEYGNAYGRFQNDRTYDRNAYQDDRNFGANRYDQNYLNQSNELNNRFKRTAGLADYGQSAANNLSTLAGQQGTSLADILGQQANASAAGITGKANAQSATISNIASYLPLLFL